MTTNGDESVASRRRSGRTIRKPELFADEMHTLSSKRKRASTLNGDQEEAGSENELEESDEDNEVNDGSEHDNDTEPEERRASRSKRPAGSKPAAKRPKTANGTSTTLAIRSASGPLKVASKQSRAQKARSRPSQMHSDGLYAEVFGKGSSAEEAASEWHESVRKDNVAGLRDLVNFILQSIGCEVRIESSDIEDIDNVPSKLGDVLEEYAQQNSTDYPLSTKKQHTGFKEVLIEFFNAIIHTLHNSGMLHDEPAVYDNIHIWTATMSGAGFRPFRHTATVISLSMSTAFCQIAQALQSSMATTKTQIEAEKKKKSTNKARVAKLQEEMKRDEARLAHIDELLRDAFDTVYVHRYRDVDEKIRVECVAALGNWIVLYRKMFLEGQYLRYLGWLLSDPNAPTRMEVIRALKALFKNRGNVGALRAFTERFRSRVVEMGSRDTDTPVRSEAIELLDRLRNAGLLQPDDIDTIGQLIFDNEPRVRKAVAKFFVSSIEDLYNDSIGELDEEQFASALQTVENVDDLLEPCQSWIKFKCLAQTLASHDQANDSHKQSERNQDIYGTENVESRYMLATQSIYPYMPDLEHWESLAGYLLFDHSSISTEVDTSDVTQAVQAAYKLESGEDAILLDVLHYSVKLYLQQLLESQTEKKSKKSQASKTEIEKKQELVAQNLTEVIPQLLNKFGGAPEAAASILRLEQLLDIDLIHDLQSGEAAYTGILDSINRQFSSHNDRKVLAEASKAFRAARTYETSQEAVDAKVAEIWHESRDTLNSLLQGKNVPARGTIDRNTLRSAGDLLERLAQLAAVNDCTEILESRISSGGGRKSKGQNANQGTLLDTLLQLVKRGIADEDTTDQFNELEDRLCGSVLTILSFYFRWKVVSLKNAITTRNTKSLSIAAMTNLAMQRSNLLESVMPVIASRQPLDAVRVTSLLTLLDLFTLFATVRHMRPVKGDLPDDVQSNLNSLSTNIPTQVVDLLMETHEKMEKRLARKTKKRIELPLEAKKKHTKTKRRSGTTATDDEPENSDEDIEKPPEDSDDESDDASNASDDGDASDEEEHESGAKGKEARKQAALVAEQALCELVSKIVLATIAGIVDSQGKTKARLQVNRSRLGKNYSQVIAYLDEKKSKTKPKQRIVAGSGGKGHTSAPAAVAAGTAATNIAGSTTVQPHAKKGQGLDSLLKEKKSEAMVIEDDDIEDVDDDDDAAASAEHSDEEDLRSKSLEDDVQENGDDEDEAEEEAAGDGNADDDVMGD